MHRTAVFSDKKKKPWVESFRIALRGKLTCFTRIHLSRGKCLLSQGRANVGDELGTQTTPCTYERKKKGKTQASLVLPGELRGAISSHKCFVLTTKPLRADNTWLVAYDVVSVECVFQSRCNNIIKPYSHTEPLSSFISWTGFLAFTTKTEPRSSSSARSYHIILIWSVPKHGELL